MECHRPDGAAPFSLLTFADARRWRTLIAETTARRYMPPWKPMAEHGGPFEGERRLSVNEIATLARWVEAGAPEGNLADLTPSPPRLDGWRQGTADLVVRMPEPYVLPADGADVFRNFVIPLPISTTRCVRGIEFRPNSRAVHHANMHIDPTAGSRRFDAADPDPGYTGPLSPDAEFPDGHFLGWTPGQAPPLLPQDMCWRLEAGSDLLLQMHMRPTGRPESVRPTVAFYFSDRPATRIPVMLRLGKQDLDLAPGESNLRVRDSYVLPVDVDVQAVQPHAHHLAREVSALAELPDGSKRWLIHIADWDFNWQDVYRFASPPRLPKGTRLVIEYVYDNSAANTRNPHTPPRRVWWGQQTTDEMGDVWIQVLARDDRDRARLASDSRAKALLEDVIGYRTMLARNPKDAALHENLAKCYMLLGARGEALKAITESVRLRPDSAAGRYNLGTALAAHGRHDEAAREFAEAIRLDAAFAYAHNSLGVSLHATGRTADAVQHFRHAIAIEPAYANAHNNLGKALEVQGHLDEAIGEYDEALRIQPDNPQTRQNMSGALTRAIAEAEEALERAVSAQDTRLAAETRERLARYRRSAASPH